MQGGSFGQQPKKGAPSQIPLPSPPPAPVLTVTDLRVGGSILRELGLLEKKQGASKKGRKGPSHQQNYRDTAEAKGSDSVKFAELTVGITGCGEGIRRNQTPTEDIDGPGF